MSDIFREVDEDLRKERYSVLWSKYGWFVIALAILIVVGTAGYRGYQYLSAQKVAQAGAQFQGATELLAANNAADAKQVLSNLAENGAGSYGDLARFKLAGLEQDGKTAAEQAEAFIALSKDAGLSQSARQLAQLRAGYLLVDTASLEKLTEVVGDLNTDTSAYRHAAREILALGAYRNGNREAAMDYLTQVTFDASAPRSIKARMEAYISVFSGHEGTSLAAPSTATGGQ